MNCVCKMMQVNKKNTLAVDKLAPLAFQFSVHGVGISFFKNSSFVFGL